MPPADVPDGSKAGVARAGQQLDEQLLRLGIEGFGPVNSARESAQEALKGRTSEQAIKVLIRNHCLIAGSQGFVTNIGGFITMPGTLPASWLGQLQRPELAVLRPSTDAPAQVSERRHAHSAS